MPTLTWTARERRLRDALLGAMLPAPGRGLPALAALDLRRFWRDFDAAAPAHLQLGLRTATLVLSGVAPRLFGHRRALDALDDDARDAVLRRAAELPGLAMLVDVVKVVACLAYFSDDAVQDVARGPR